MGASRWVLLSLLAVTITLALSSVGGALANPSPQPVAAHNPSWVDSIQFHQLIEKKYYPRASSATTLTSVGAVAVSVLVLLNGSEQIVLFNAERDSTTIVQAVVPGGANAFVVTELAAGGNFFVEFENALSGAFFYEEISPTGVMSTPPLPIPLNYYWTIVAGNANTLFASSLGGLVSINPWTFEVRANYSSLIPPLVTVTSVLADGRLLYIAGDQTVGSGGLTPFYGFIDKVTSTETTLSPSASTGPSDLDGTIFAIGEANGNVYFGGQLALFEVSPVYFATVVEGYLFEYSPHSGVVTNLSSLDPISKWGVYAIFDLGPTIGMTISQYVLTATGSREASGTYVLAPSHARLINDTRLTGDDFVTVADQTSLSAGLLFVGGTDTVSGAAEIAAVPAFLFLLGIR
ncbi:MAG: hypothetical protein ACLQL8_02050 [Thermoplasmata archaeon]